MRLDEAAEKKMLIKLCDLQSRLLGKCEVRTLPNSTGRLMRLPEVLEITGVSESTIRRMEQEGRFP